MPWADLQPQQERHGSQGRADENGSLSAGLSA